MSYFTAVSRVLLIAFLGLCLNAAAALAQNYQTRGNATWNVNGNWSTDGGATDCVCNPAGVASANVRIMATHTATVTNAADIGLTNIIDIQNNGTLQLNVKPTNPIATLQSTTGGGILKMNTYLMPSVTTNTFANNITNTILVNVSNAPLQFIEFDTNSGFLTAAPYNLPNLTISGISNVGAGGNSYPTYHVKGLLTVESGAEFYFPFARLSIDGNASIDGILGVGNASSMTIASTSYTTVNPSGTMSIGFNGLTIQGTLENLGTFVTNNFVTVEVQSGGVVLNKNSMTINDDTFVIRAGGTVNNQGTFGITNTFGRLNVEGTFNQQTSGVLSLSGGAIATFTNTATYNHERDGGSLPTATWGASSNCNVTGITFNSLGAASFEQTFGNFNWNCTGQLVSQNTGTGAAMNVLGDFNVANTNNNILRFARDLNVSGNYTDNVGTASLDFYTNSATATFNGTGTQTITLGFPVTRFHNLVINKSAGVVDVSGSSHTILVSNALTLDNGRIKLNDNDLSFAGAADDITRTNGWVEANSTATYGAFAYNSGVAATNVLFPVGDATNYQPIQIANVTASGAWARFITPNISIPVGGVGSWLVRTFGGTSAVSILNPQGGTIDAASQIYINPNFAGTWTAVPTTYSTPDYTSSGIATTGDVDEFAVYNPIISIADGGFANEDIYKTLKQKIYTLQISASGSTTLISLDIPTNGTYTASDIDNFGLFHNTVDDLATATLLSSTGSTSSGSGETISFTSFSETLSGGIPEYFYLVADISPTATTGNTISTPFSFPFTNFGFSTSVTNGGSSYGSSGTKTIAAPYQTRGNATWNVNGNWSTDGGATDCACNPAGVVGADVRIMSGHTVDVINSMDIETGNSIDVRGTLNLPDGNGNAIATLTTSAGSTINLTGGSLNLVNPTTTTINGTLNFNTGGTVPNSMTFAGGSTYIHAIDGGVIPTATWNVASTVNVTGVTNNMPTGFAGQNFGNLTWDCLGQSAGLAFNANFTIAGDFNASAAGTNMLLGISDNNLSTDYTITTRNFNLSGGVNFIPYIGGTSIRSGILEIQQNATINSGTIMGAIGGTSIMRFVGANNSIFNYNSNTFTLSGTDKWVLECAKTAPATLEMNSTNNFIYFTAAGGTPSSILRLTSGTVVLANNLALLASTIEGIGTLDMAGTNTALYLEQYNSTDVNTFTGTLNAGNSSVVYYRGISPNDQNIFPAAYHSLSVENSGIKTLVGDISLTGNFTNTTGSPANYIGSYTTTFNGTSPQTITGATNFHNLEINQSMPSTVTLVGILPIEVSNILTLTSGRLVLGANDITLSGIIGTQIAPSGSGWIETDAAGRLIRQGSATGTIDFPVGDVSNKRAIQLDDVAISATVGFVPTPTPNFYPSGSPTREITGMWEVTQGGNITVGTVRLKNVVPPLNVTDDKIHRKTGAMAGDWVQIVTGGTAPDLGTVPYAFVANDLNTFAAFTPFSAPNIVINTSPTVPANNVLRGTNNNILYQFSAAVTLSDATLTEVKLTTGGTYAIDINNLKLRYSTDAILDVGDVTFATIFSPPTAGVQTFTGSQLIPVGTGYFFLTADIGAGASVGNTINIEAPAATADFNFGIGTVSFASIPLAGGTQTIIASPQPLGNRGLYFNDGRVDFGNDNSLTTPFSGNFTIEAWIKMDKLIQDNNIGILYSWHGSNTQFNFNLIAYSGAGDATYRLSITEPSGNQHTTNNNLFPLKQWTHVTATFDGTDIRYYVNGTLVGTVTKAGDSFTSTGFPIRSGGNFPGQIDDIRVFSGVRTQAEIQTDMGTTTPNGAVGYWNFDQSTGLQADNTGTAGALAHGTLEAIPTNLPLWALRTTNTLDDGSVGSLRWAITEANLDTDTDYIDFSIQQTNTSAVSTITLGSNLPTISEPTVLDAYSAYGSSPNTGVFGAANNAQLRVEINANGVARNAFEVGGTATNVVIKGFSIYGATNTASPNDGAIHLFGDNNRVEGCYIGLLASGTIGTPANQRQGIAVNGSNNIVGWSGSLMWASLTSSRVLPLMGSTSTETTTFYKGIILAQIPLERQPFQILRVVSFFLVTLIRCLRMSSVAIHFMELSLLVVLSLAMYSKETELVLRLTERLLYLMVDMASEFSLVVQLITRLVVP